MNTVGESTAVVKTEPGEGEGSQLAADDNVVISKLLPVAEELELPTFSSGVTHALNENRSSDVWPQIIDEMSLFYIRKFPDRMKCTEDYQIVGKNLYRRFPSISR